MVNARKKHLDTLKGVVEELEDSANADLERLFKKVVMLIVFEVGLRPVDMKGCANDRKVDRRSAACCGRYWHWCTPVPVQ